MDPLDITDKEKLFAYLEQRRRGKSRVIDEEAMFEALQRRVQGQDHILKQVSRFIRLQWAKEQRGKPIANLLFVGPPATGKTELAKAMTEYLFDDEKYMRRFECSELSGPEGKTRLIGTPKGYQGSEDGGQLTRPMFSNPRRLILFDEIEKAYSGMFDLFLSLMGEGRLTEQGSGRAADFTQSVIVLTSNAHHEEMVELLEQIDNPVELEDSARSILKASKTFRPELVSRFDHILVFKPLDTRTQSRVAALKIIKAASEYGVRIIDIDHEIVGRIVMDGNREVDARELGRRVDAAIGEVLVQARERGYKAIKIVRNESDEAKAVEVAEDSHGAT